MMMHITIVLAAFLLVVPASWAAEPAADAVTTTTLPDHNRGYGPPPNDPRGLPTGLPGMGMPAPRPADEKEKATPPAGAQ
jgi:hypothetical protein